MVRFDSKLLANRTPFIGRLLTASRCLNELEVHSSVRPATGRKTIAAPTLTQESGLVCVCGSAQTMVSAAVAACRARRNDSSLAWQARNSVSSATNSG